VNIFSPDLINVVVEEAEFFKAVQVRVRQETIRRIVFDGWFSAGGR
jgi:hypothetical protein